MITLRDLQAEFGNLSEYQLRTRIDYLKEYGLIEVSKGDYQRLLLPDDLPDLLRRLARFEEQTQNIRDAVRLLAAEVKGNGAVYQLMSKEELIAIIYEKDQEIARLNAKIKELRDRMKPAELSLFERLRAAWWLLTGRRVKAGESGE
jgi:hypothetical protein